MLKDLLIRKECAMPNSRTFSIKPIRKLIDKYNHGLRVDPFANASKLCSVSNDINGSCGCDYSMDALDFLKTFDDDKFDFLLFDPPYSPRQVSECYKQMGRTVNMQTTQASFWGNLKKEIARVLKVDGACITFGWNSGGIGKSLGFEQIEILLVAHGGWHNDTICTVERKIRNA